MQVGDVCGRGGRKGKTRAQELEHFIGSRLGGPGVSAERPVSITEDRHVNASTRSETVCRTNAARC
jgi:hypothetical protein